MEELTPEQVERQQDFAIPYKEAKRLLDEIRDEEAKTRKPIMEEVRKARAFACYGDEWGKVKTRPVGGDKLQLAVAAGMVDLLTGIAFDNDLQATIRAIQPPEIDEMQAEWFKQMSMPLAVDPTRPQWVMELLGEIKTTELDTYRREIKTRAKMREAYRRAIVDRCGVLKDSHRVIDTPTGPKVEHNVDVLVYGDEYFTQRNREFSKVAWHIQDKYMEKADFAREYPWIIERYNQKHGVAGTFAFFQKYFQTQKDELAFKKRQELQKPSVKVREIWYKMPAERPGAEKFHGGWIVMEVFEDEILRVYGNPYLDGRLPFHPIVPKPAEDAWDGVSFIYSHHDGITAMNKTASMAMLNVIDACNSVRVWNPAALQDESAERIRRTGEIGLINVILKSGKTFDEAFKQLQPSEISQSIFAVHNLLQGIVATATGLDLRRDKQVDENGKTVGGDTSSGPQLALMMDAVKEQAESLFFALCSRGTQYAVGPRAFTLAGEEAISITLNPQIFYHLYGPTFFEYFSLTVSEAEPQPENPTERTQDMITRVDAAGKLTEQTGLPLTKTLTITKPYGYTSMVKDIKRAEMEAAQKPQQPTPEELEKQAIKDNEITKTIAQAWQKYVQEKASDPTQREVVGQMFMDGEARPFLEASIAGQPFTPKAFNQGPMLPTIPAPAPNTSTGAETLQMQPPPMVN